MYLNFNVCKIIVLTGFEAAAYVNEHLGPLDKFGEYDLDDALSYGFSADYVHPLCDDQFESWSLEATTKTRIYPEAFLATECTPFYYVQLDDAQNRTVLESMFSEKWLDRREYMLRYTIAC